MGSLFLRQHNEVIPQAALSGLTPTEAYLGVDQKIMASQLHSLAVEKRQMRLEQNRVNVCPPCKQKLAGEIGLEIDLENAS